MAEDDDLNIFEEFYESIKPGGTFDQRALDFGKAVTDVLTPNEQTQAEIDAYDKQRQDALNLLFQASGVDPKSFEGGNLAYRFRRDKDLQQLLGFEQDIGKEFKYDFAKLGKFLFGDANDGLTTMKEQGTKFKELPFNQKFGIVMLPIDALDVIGIGVLAKGGLSPLVKAGIKKYGAKSGKTIQDLINDEDLVQAMMQQNPSFLDELDDALGGGYIQKRYASGKKKRGPTPAERDQGIKPIGRDFLQKQKQQRPTTTIDPNLLEAAKKAEGKRKPGGTGVNQYTNNPVLTPDGEKFIRDRYETMSDQEIADVFNQNPEKYMNKESAGKYTIMGYRERNKLKKTAKGGTDEKGSGGDFLSFAPAVKARNQNLEKITNNFKSKIGEGKIDINNPDEMYAEFEKVYRAVTGDNRPKLHSGSGHKEYFKYVDEYNRLNPDAQVARSQPALIQAKKKKFIEDAGLGDEASLDDAIRSKFSKAMRETYAKSIDPALVSNINIISDFDPKTRYLNFIRRTRSDLIDLEKDPNFTKFFSVYNPADLDTPGSKFYKDFQKFKELDSKRIEIGRKLDPILQKLFPDDTKFALNIAHKFESSRIGETVQKSKAGKGGDPDELYIDFNVINTTQQRKLEARARKLTEKYFGEGDQAGKREDLVELTYIDSLLRDFGSEGQAVAPIKDDLGNILYEPGFKFGKAETNLVAKIINLAESKGYNFTKNELETLSEVYDILGPVKKAEGGLVGDVDDIFEEEDEIMRAKKSIFPRISIEFGDAARGTKRSFGEEKPEDMVPLPLEEIQLGDATPVKRDAPQQKVFDVPPMENIFTGEVQEANLKLPFFKLFTKPPVNETAPIPTPKEALDNPTKKQLQSLEQEKLNKEQDFFDPTPEDNQKVDLGSSTDVAVTPKTNQPLTGVFYSDAEKVLQRPDTPVIFPNKQALIDFFAKNRIKRTELEDYGINNLLKAFDDTTPIPKDAVIRQIRSAPVRGMHVHGTGKGSEIINPSGEKVNVAYEGYREDGFIPGTTSERVLYIPMDKLPGDTAGQPIAIFSGENIQNHAFGLPGGSDNNYIVGWTRLSERNALLPTKLDAPAGKSKIPGLTRERDRIQRQLAGLFAEAQNKLNAQAQRRGIPVDEVQAPSLEQMLSTYADTLNEISPGLVDQMDELIVKARDLDSEITKASTVDASNVVRVQFADEIQSDIMQAAAGRKQKLLATLRKLQEEGRESTTLPDLDRIGNEALAFFEKNKSVFRPLKKSQTEVDIFADSLLKVDADIDDIINRFVETREISDADITRVKSLLNDQIDQMINDLITVDANTYDGLFPDLPFKKREEWADALIKKDLFELAYRKFVLKDPNVPDYYAVTPDTFVINRYNFNGNTATSAADRAADKAEQIKVFTERGEFMKSRYRGIGMSEFYGGPNAVDQNGKHYTSTIEKILKTQAKSNNSEMIILNVQTKAGGSDVYRITDQNGNMVATLTDARQAQTIRQQNPNYNVEAIRVPDMKNTTPSFAIKITEEMLEPYKTHKARGGLVEMIDIFEVA